MANGKKPQCAVKPKAVVKSQKGDENAVKKLESTLKVPQAKTNTPLKLGSTAMATFSAPVNTGVFPKTHLVGEHDSTLKKKSTSSALALATTGVMMAIATALF